MTDACPPAPHSNRARGAIAAGFRRVGAHTEVVGPRETGGYRLRLPRGREGHREAVIVNTGGGMAGGDRAFFAFEAGPGAAVTVTTAAAEKVYRGVEAGGAPAETRVEVDLTLGPGAALEWLPQETILFDGARLSRRLSVDMAPDAALILVEMLVFGRLAMGERVVCGCVRDRWRVRRGGRLVLAEDLDLAGDPTALLDRPALGGGARASATLIMMSPEAEGLLAPAREILAAAAVAGGASAWGGRLVARATSPSPARLRVAVVALLSGLRGRAPPRLWA